MAKLFKKSFGLCKICKKKINYQIIFVMRENKFKKERMMKHTWNYKMILVKLSHRALI